MEVHGEAFGNEAALFLEHGFDDGSLRLQCTAKVENIALHYGDLKDHFLFFAVKDIVFDGVEVFGDVIEARKARIHEEVEDVIHEVGGRFAHVKATLPLVFFECFEEIRYLKHVVAVSGDEVRVGEDDVHFARIGGAVFRIEERNVYGEEEAIVEGGCFGLVGWR